MAYQFVRASTQTIQAFAASASGHPMTLAAWVYLFSTASTPQVALSVGQSNSSPGHRHSLGFALGNWRLGTRGSVSGGPDITANAFGNSATVNVWTHLTGVCNSLSSRSVYVDGALQGTNTTALSSINAFSRTTIGGDIDGSPAGIGSNLWGGLVAECGVWNVVLTADEIASLGKGVTCDQVRPQSLVFYAPLIRNINDIARGISLTNVNTATVADHPRIYI